MSVSVTVNGNTYVFPDNFQSYGWVNLLGSFAYDLGAQMLSYVNSAQSAATTATTSAATQGTSTTSLTIGTGSQSLTIQTGKGLLPGMAVRIAKNDGSANYMDGLVTSYSSGTGALVVNVTAVTGAGTIAAWNVFMEGPPGPASGLLYSLKGANLNSTADQTLTAYGTAPSKYLITSVVATNASGSPTTAVGGVYSAASKGGQAIVYAGQAYSALTSAAALQQLAFGTGAAELSYTTTPIFSLTTPQGSAMTCDIYVFGAALP